jgi:two-component system, OmpR family, KDP operon response regulator KdpE
MSAERILLIDDELSIRRAITTLLRSRGYAVVAASTGAEGIELFEAERPNLVIVDLGLPDMHGTVVCQQLRARGTVPIIVLSVTGEERSKVAALDAGGDDYVTKPFGPEELLARIRAGLRRPVEVDRAARGRVQYGGLIVDFDLRRVYRDDTDLRLTPREFELLTLLAGHAGRVLTHRMILKTIWGVNGEGQQEHLRVLVGQLRKKVEIDPSHPRYVLTEPWVGYCFSQGGPAE